MSFIFTAASRHMKSFNSYKNKLLKLRSSPHMPSTCICTCRYVYIIHTKSKLYLLSTKVKNGTTNLCYNSINNLTVLTRQLIPASLESSCLLFVETVSLHYIVHAGLIVMILLPQHPKSWDYRYEPLSPAEFSF